MIKKGKLLAPGTRITEELIDKKLTIKSNYFFLLFTYLILPAVSTNIFRVFSVDTGPDDVSGDYSWYMRADYSIATNSSKYVWGRAYAAAMIFVYPIGIPVYYLYVLYTARDAIQSRVGKKESEDPQDENVSKKQDIVHERAMSVSAKKSAKIADYNSGKHDTSSWLTKLGYKPQPTFDLTDEQIMRPLKFLFLAYEPEFWYWE
eukprot:gene36749-45334_t